MIAQANSLFIPLPDQSVHCVVTSPPFWSLRDYGLPPTEWPTVTYTPMAGLAPVTVQGCESGCRHEWGNEVMLRPSDCAGPKQATNVGSTGRDSYSQGSYCLRCGGWRGCLGLEPTPEMYVAHLVAVFREVKRVLRDDGQCFVNIGDTRTADRQWQGIPQMLCFALQADGWRWEDEVVWSKPNAMPSSQTNRFTRSHEMLYLFNKSRRAFFDADAVRERADWNSKLPDGWDIGPGGHGTIHRNGRSANPNVGAGGSSRNRRSVWNVAEERDPLLAYLLATLALDAPELLDDVLRQYVSDAGKKRTAWSIATESFSGAHFATFPTALVRPCILAGTSARGVCPQCSAPWERVVEVAERHIGGGSPGIPLDARGPMAARQGSSHSDREGLTQSTKHTLGWRPGCGCGCPDDTLPDDFEYINTPTGSRAGDDPSFMTGRAGYNRPRSDDEGQRPITRYEQRKYAEQLKVSLHRATMEHEAGDAFAHYIRTDKSGARPIPPELLERWLECGWLARVIVPQWSPPEPVPATVLDPFVGSGTCGEVCRTLPNPRRFVGLDLSRPYLRDLALARSEYRTPAAALSELPLFEEAML